MNLDRDLGDALRPLAGDPVADAMRVLAALPPGALPPGSPEGTPPPDRAPRRTDRGRPTPRWLPWTLLALGLAAGIGIGLALGHDPAQRAPDAPRPEQRSDERQPDVPPPDPGLLANTQGNDPRDKQPKPDPDKPLPPAAGFVMPANYADRLLLTAFGPVAVEEPKAGRQDLDAGAWEVELGTRFKTQTGQVGLFVNANDARVRLDFDTEARVDVDRVTLEFGRMWLDTGSRDAHVRVDCGDVHIRCADAAVTIARAPSGIEVLVLSGSVDVTTPADAARVAGHELLLVDPDGHCEPKTAVPFLAPSTSWMTRMIAQSSDPSEFSARVQEVYAAYEAGTWRDAARHELLKLGSRTVWLLADGIERALPTDRAFALESVQLLARVVDYSSAGHALSLLLLDDAEIRAQVFRAVRDATGTDGGTDEPFWLDAARERRRTVVDSWRTQLLR